MRARPITNQEQKSKTVRSRSFYVMTLRANAKKKDLIAPHYPSRNNSVTFRFSSESVFSLQKESKERSTEWIAKAIANPVVTAIEIP